MALAHITTPLNAKDVVKRVSEMSRRGKLPGFERGGDGLFSCLAYGWSFLDQRLICDATENDVTTLRFRTVLPARMPLIIAVIFLLTIWPGVWLTNEMLVTYWDWYLGLTGSMPWLTYAWYLPLTVIPLPWTFKSMMRRSHAAAEVSAMELIERLAPVVEGEMHGQPDAKSA